MKTTDLNTIRKNPNHFTWGRVTDIIDVGPSYTIVQCVPERSFTDNEGKTSFHIYVDGLDTSRSSPTLEGALVMAIALKKLGNNADSMGRAAAKLLEV